MSATSPRRRSRSERAHRLAAILPARLRASRGHWTRPGIAAAAGATAVIAAATAAGLIATAGGSPAPAAPNSAAALDTAQSGLQAIFKLHPDLGKPVDDLIKAKALPAPSFTGDHGTVGVPLRAQRAAATGASSSARHYVPPASYSGSFTPLQLASLALRAGCSASEAATAAAIAAAESGGNPGAEGDISLMSSTWDWSEGLWQIRGLRAERGTGQLRDSLANADPVTNSEAMVAISSGCTDWTPWSTYNSGAYLAYLPLMSSAVAAAEGYRGRTGALPPIGSAAGPARVPQAPSDTTHRRHAGKRHHHGHRSATHHPARHRHPAASSPPAGPKPSHHPSAHPSTPAAPSPSGNPVPTKLPTKLPSKLPTKLPTKLPSTPPIPLPSVTLPSLPLPTPSLPLH